MVDPPGLRRPPARVLVVADASALLAFVLVGIRSHHEVGALDLVARNVIPLGVAWFVIAAAVGTYRRASLRTLLVNWIVAVPLGVVARSLWVGSPSGSRLLLFVGVALAFTLLFLLVGRRIAGLLGRRVLPVGPDP